MLYISAKLNFNYNSSELNGVIMFLCKIGVDERYDVENSIFLFSELFSFSKINIRGKTAIKST